MRKMLWAVPMAASLTLTGAVGQVLTSTPVQAANQMLQDESAKWLKIDSAHKTVTIKVMADATNENNGHNFDGYSRGGMQVRVPQGWKVNVTFQNDSTEMPHSVMIVPYPQHNLLSGFKTAFLGASTPSPTAGIMSGTTQSFHFTANKSGTFAMICGVPYHSAKGGMWEKFIVSSKYKSPSVLVMENASTSSGYGGGY